MANPPAKYLAGGAFGVISLSRACGPYPALPQSQGYIGTGGAMFMPMPSYVFAHPGMAISDAKAPPGPGIDFAPGQGGDTPGSGGQVLGQTVPVETLWITDGVVTPPPLVHRPGTVGFTGARRSRA